MTPTELGKNTVLIRRYIVNIRKKKKKNGEGNGNSFLLGKSQGQRSLAGYSPGCLAESVTTEHACMADSLHCTAETKITL